ncbi:MAG: serine/threonine-protein kinase [Actinomycetota bacterium]
MADIPGEAIDSAASALGVVVTDRIDKGGQKAVALCERESVQYVLKCVAVDPSAGDHSLERARREVGVLEAISSPHVVSIEDGLLEVPGVESMVAWTEEYIDGDDLTDLAPGGWSWEAVRSMLVDLAVGLSEFHAREVAHRDLSTNNIRQRSSGGWVIIDPGLARFMTMPTLTLYGQHFGTPGFMSPEHVSTASRPTNASDVYVLGVIGYLCLTGSLPIPFAGDVAAYVDQLRAGTYQPVEALRPDLDAEARDVIGRCLHRHPARRFLDASELLEALS